MYIHLWLGVYCVYTTCRYFDVSHNQGCGNFEPTAGHFDLFTTLVLPIYFVYSSVSIYWTFTRFIGQCLAWLTVSTPLPTTIVYIYIFIFIFIFIFIVWCHLRSKALTVLYIPYKEHFPGKCSIISWELFYIIPVNFRLPLHYSHKFT